MIKLQALKKQYPNQTQFALDDLSISISRGEKVALMGPSGCGKSTLLNIIAGLDHFNEGEASVLNNNWFLASDDMKTQIRKKEMGFVFQFFNLLPTLTVEENIALPLALNNFSLASQKQKVSLIAEQVGLVDKLERYPSQLSGGQMQRCAIARALIHQPQLILADEPTGNLDSQTSEEILTLLDDLCTEHNQTLLMVTHNIEATRIATRLIEMKDGRVLKDTALK